VADRQARYAEQAEREKQESTRDQANAAEEGKLASELDAEEEKRICDEFNNYRKDVSRMFRNKANELENLAERN
jgi:hypothetical protein